jgi:hypothetical protein
MSDDWYATPQQLDNNVATIHSDRDCCALGFANEIVAVDRTDFTDDAVCEACERRDNDEAQCNGLHQRLDEMDAGELIADD